MKNFYLIPVLVVSFILSFIQINASPSQKMTSVTLKNNPTLGSVFRVNKKVKSLVIIEDNILEKNQILNFLIGDENYAVFNAFKNEKISSEIIQLFSHGKPGQLLMEGKWMNAEGIYNYLAQNQSLILTEVNQLNIYGCNFAKGTKGKEAVKYLENKLGVTVSASDDITGIDGDWELEVNKSLYSDVMTITNYTGNFQLPTNVKVPLVNDSDFSGLTPNVKNNVTGFLQPCLGGVYNVSNLVDSDLTNSTSLSITGLGCDAEIAVEINDTILAGAYTGFSVSSSGLLNGSVLSEVKVRTYLGGVEQDVQTVVSSLVGVSSGLVNGNGRVTLGFLTTKDFDEVSIEYDALVGVLFTTNIYNAVIEEFAPAPNMDCNTTYSWTNTDFPVVLQEENTGLSGLACVGCSITNSENIIDSDLTNYASVQMLVSAGSIASLAIEDVLTTYPAGTFVGFDIENSNLVGANVLSGLSVVTYLDGALQENISAASLISLVPNLLLGTDRQTAGTITSLPFDRAELRIVNLLGVTNNTKIYGAVIKKLCPRDINCDSTYFLQGPEFPIAINNARTGISGVLCLACEVDSAVNIISEDTVDYTKIKMLAGVAATGSVSVLNQVSDYPVGSKVGFTIEDENALLQLDLLNSLSICTYLDGVQQECKSGTDLLSLSLSTLLISYRTGLYNIGFKTTKPFDEVQLNVSSLVGLNNDLKIYGTFVNTEDAIGGGLDCYQLVKAILDRDTTYEEQAIVVYPLLNDTVYRTKLDSANTNLINPSGNNTTLMYSDGSFLYTPNNEFIGDDTLQYVVRDTSLLLANINDTGLIIIHVIPVKDTIGISTPEDSSFTVCDTNLNGVSADSVAICGGGNHGTSTIAGTCITYQPSVNYIGNDTACYIVCKNGVCDTTIVAIIIGPGNIDTINVTMLEDSSFTLCDTTLNNIDADSVLICDGGDNGISTIAGTCITYSSSASFVGMDTTCYIVCKVGICDTTIVVVTVIQKPKTDTTRITIPEDSSFVLCDTALSEIVGGNVSICGGGNNGISTISGSCITYQPLVNSIGNDTTCYIVCKDGVCDTTIVVITIAPPVIDTIRITILEDSSLTLCDTNLNGIAADSVVICDGGDNGISAITGACITYTPTVAYLGNDTTCYIVCKDGICDTTIVVVTVIKIPKIDTVNVTIPEDSSFVMCDTALSNIVGGMVSVCNGGANGISTITGTCIEYIPTANYIGNDTGCFIVCKDGVCDTTIVTITVTEVTDTIQIVIPEDSSFTLCDTNLNGITADSVVICNGGTNGGSTITGTCIEYIPTANYIGNDTTCLIVCNDGICDTTIVTITVTEVTDTIQIVIPEDSSFILCDTNLNGITADSVVICNGGANGISTITGTCIEYIPTANYIGNDTTCYIVCNDGICDTTIVTITVTEVTDTIQIVIPEDSSFTLCDTNLNGITADSVVICNGGTNGGSTITGTCIEYIPTANYIGNDTTCYIVCNDGICDTTIVTITVTEVTDTIQIVIPEDSSFTLCDTNLNGITADSVVICNGGTNGGSVITGTCITYTPSLNYVGNDTACYIVCNDGICDTTIVIYTIIPTNLTIDTIITINPVICLDTTEMHSSIDSISTCDGIPLTRNGGVVVPNVGTGCVTISPIFGGGKTDTTCVVACANIAGVIVCDTTIIISVKAPVSDTFVIQLEGVPGQGDTCLSVNELLGTSYTFNRLGFTPYHGSATSYNDTCIGYIQTSTTKRIDTAHIVICDEYGICDTTLIIYLPTPTKDTIVVGPVIPSTTANTCGMLESSFMTGMHIGTCSGSWTSYGGVTISTTGLCVNYPAPSSVFMGDTVCAVICDTIVGTVVCDTTIIIYYPDTIAPTVVCKNDTVYLDGIGVAIIDTSHTLTSVSDNSLLSSVWLSQSTFGCGDVGVNSVTTYARDTNSNIDSCVSTIVVLDTVPPTASCQNITVQLDSNGNVSITPAMVDGGSVDNCSSVNLTINKSNFNCGDIGINTVMLTVTDIYGNSSTCQANVTIEDNIAPIIICIADKQREVENSKCTYEVEDFIPEITVSDNCGNGGITFVQSPSAGTLLSLQNTSQTITISATDVSGNETTCTFDVFVKCEKKVMVSQMVSPNGDGYNDTWVIPELSSLGNNSVKVFNRWGNLVYKKNNYQNDWNGVANVGTNAITGSSHLPSGTYFYIIEIEGLKPMNGYLQLQND